jgi:hypothetical protein
MAQHPFYSQSQDVSDGITEFESIRPSPLSETIPLFGAGTRSSTWPIASNGSHDVDYDYTESEYDGDVDNQMQDVEVEASDSGSIEPCEYGQIVDFQLLTRRSDIRAHRTP